MSLAAAILAESEELAPLLMPPLAFAGVAVAIFAFLALVVWSYRDVANRHFTKVNDGTSDDSHGAGH
jgi:hypothetical protein